MFTAATVKATFYTSSSHLPHHPKASCLGLSALCSQISILWPSKPLPCTPTVTFRHGQRDINTTDACEVNIILSQTNSPCLHNQSALRPRRWRQRAHTDDSSSPRCTAALRMLLSSVFSSASSTSWQWEHTRVSAPVKRTIPVFNSDIPPLRSVLPSSRHDSRARLTPLHIHSRHLRPSRWQYAWSVPHHNTRGS